MTLNDYCTECYNIALAHGWWDRERSPLEIAALLMTELAEFVEEARRGGVVDGGITEAAKEELADVFIRLADYCGRMKIDLDDQVQVKMDKNRNRPYRHGGKTY